MKKHHYSLVLAHSSGRSRSRYSGGFTTINGRLNNSSAYNHDYYVKNKDKWADNRVRSSRSARISDTKKKLAYYQSVGEDQLFGDWSPDKYMYVQGSPEFQDAYSKWEEAESYYQYTGDPQYKAQSDKAGVNMIEEMLRIGDNYDRANGIEPSHNYTPRSGSRRTDRGGEVRATHNVTVEDNDVERDSTVRQAYSNRRSGRSSGTTTRAREYRDSYVSDKRDAWNRKRFRRATALKKK